MLPPDWTHRGARELVQEAHRIHVGFLRGLFGGASAPFADAAPAPRINVLESDDGIVVVVALPGVAEEAVDVRVEGGWLVIEGTRAADPADAAARVHRMEIPSGPFARRLRLPGGPNFHVRSTTWSRGLFAIGLRRTP